MSTFRSRENIQKHFLSLDSSHVTQDLKKLRWPERIVKLRKGQKYSKILKTIANLKTLLKFVILISSEQHSIVSRDYLVCLFQALSSFIGS